MINNAHVAAIRSQVNEAVLLDFVPRKVPTSGWPNSDYTMILEIDLTSSDFTDIEYILHLYADLRLQAYYPGSINRIESNFPNRNSIESASPGLLRILLSQNVAGYSSLYFNDSLVNQGTANPLSHSEAWCGIGAANDGVSDLTTNQATKFKVISGVYTDFTTADSISGAGLIFNGLVP